MAVPQARHVGLPLTGHQVHALTHAVRVSAAAEALGICVTCGVAGRFGVIGLGHCGLLDLIAGRGWFLDGRAAHAACTDLPGWSGSTDSARNARLILPSRPTHGANTRP